MKVPCRIRADVSASVNSEVHACKYPPDVQGCGLLAFTEVRG